MVRLKLHTRRHRERDHAPRPHRRRRHGPLRSSHILAFALGIVLWQVALISLKTSSSAEDPMGALKDALEQAQAKLEVHGSTLEMMRHDLDGRAHASPAAAGLDAAANSVATPSPTPEPPADEAADRTVVADDDAGEPPSQAPALIAHAIAVGHSTIPSAIVLASIERAQAEQTSTSVVFTALVRPRPDESQARIGDMLRALLEGPRADMFVLSGFETGLSRGFYGGISTLSGPELLGAAAAETIVLDAPSLADVDHDLAVLPHLPISPAPGVVAMTEAAAEGLRWYVQDAQHDNVGVLVDGLTCVAGRRYRVIQGARLAFVSSANDASSRGPRSADYGTLFVSAVRLAKSGSRIPPRLRGGGHTHISPAVISRHCKSSPCPATVAVAPPLTPHPPLRPPRHHLEG